MKHIKLFLILSMSALVFTTSCTHTASKLSTPEPTKALISLDKAIDADVLGIELENDLNLWQTEAQKFSELAHKKGFNGAVKQICEKEEKSPFCQSSSLPRYRFLNPTPKARPVAKKDFATWMRNKDFASLNALDLNQLVKGLGNISEKVITANSELLVADTQCYKSSLYTAFGTSMENSFPEKSAITTTMALYKKATECDAEESAHRAAYRLGLMYVWQDQCPAAISLFEKVQKHPAVSFLHSRSRYWQLYCKDSSSSQEEIASQRLQKLQDFPLSFHTLLYFGDRSDEIYEKVAAMPEPNISFRTSMAPEWNSPVRVAEAFLKTKDLRSAKEILERIDLNQVENLEPEFRLYLSVLFHRAQMALPKFRLLAKLFSQSPQYSSLTALKIYYPLWYYDIVKNEGPRELDPFLIISLVRQESAFNPNAQSNRGAMGLMQLLPSTARRIASVKRQELSNPEKNIKAGVRFFNHLLKRYDNKPYLALSAYNAGPLVVDRWLTRYPTKNDTLFMDLIPYRETREYAAIILRNYFWYTKLYPQDHVIETSQPMAGL